MYKLIFDIETNGLHPDKVWCICTMDADTGEEHRYNMHQIEDALDALKAADILIGHNILDFDLPVLSRLYGFRYNIINTYDTCIMSRLLRPDRGYHSLEAWGERLHIHKFPDLDWSIYIENMLERCSTDVKITKGVWDVLQLEQTGWDWGRAQSLEHNIAYWHSKQKENGVLFDVDAATVLANTIQERLEHCINKLKEKMPYVIQTTGTVTRPFCVNGSYKANVLRWFDKPTDVIGPFTHITFNESNPNSDVQIKRWLTTLGWIPDEWNYRKDKRGHTIRPLEKTSPKITDSSLELLGEIGELIKDVGMLSHRLSLLRSSRDETKGLIKNIREDGRVVADGIPMGTPTGRYRHIGVVNIPKAKPHIPYGKEMRSLFICPSDSVLIGSDAKGIESRAEAHYTFPYDNGEYAHELLEGDVHDKNAELWGVIRDKAKNGKYALLYGAQANKLAQTLGIAKSLGTQFFDKFWEGNDALKRLHSDVVSASKRGYLKGLDGRKLYTRSEHSALNTLLQSFAAIVVKQATILLNERATKDRLPYKQVLHMHDEVLIEIPNSPDVIEHMTSTIEQAWKDAGEMLDVRVPIEGDIKIGKNWAIVH